MSEHTKLGQYKIMHTNLLGRKVASRVYCSRVQDEIDIAGEIVVVSQKNVLGGYEIEVIIYSPEKKQFFSNGLTNCHLI